MAVRLTAPHPVHGEPGKLLSNLDVQAERDLILAGYAVDTHAAPKPKPKPRKQAPRKRAAESKPDNDGDSGADN